MCGSGKVTTKTKKGSDTPVPSIVLAPPTTTGQWGASPDGSQMVAKPPEAIAAPPPTMFDPVVLAAGQREMERLKRLKGKGFQGTFSSPRGSGGGAKPKAGLLTSPDGKAVLS